MHLVPKALYKTFRHITKIVTLVKVQEKGYFRKQQCMHASKMLSHLSQIIRFLMMNRDGFLDMALINIEMENLLLMFL